LFFELFNNKVSAVEGL